MTFYLIGINYKTTPISDYESAYRLKKHIYAFWNVINHNKTALLITCNRIEIYGVAGSLNEARMFIESFKGKFSRQFENAYIFYEETKIYRHGLRLASGLESQLKGERQILEQLKTWLANKDFPAPLKDIWRQIITQAKQIRAKSGLDKNSADIAEIVSNDFKRYIPDKKNVEIIIIGTGKIAELFAKAALENTKLTFLARKKRLKAQRLAEISKAAVSSFDKLPELLKTADIIITATSSPHYILNIEDFKGTEKRKKLLRVYDLAVPRDVAPGIDRIPFVLIHRSDNLIKDFLRNSRIKIAIELAEGLVEEMRYEYNKNWHAA